MRKYLVFVSALAAGVGLATAAIADPKPKGAKNADPQAVIDIYLGKTWEWSKGGSYWGGGGAFQGVWDDDPTDPAVSFTDGKWYVTSKGTLCYDTVWTWTTPSGEGGQGSPRNFCWRHVVAPDGQVWRSDHRDEKDFHRVNFDQIKSGNQIKRTYNKYKSLAGS